MASVDGLRNHGESPSAATVHRPSPNTQQLGYVADLSLLDVPDNGITGLAWRLMMASAAIPAVIACFLVYLGPESPRWFLTRDQHSQAYAAMVRLRNTRVQAARDLFYAHVLMKEEQKVVRSGSKAWELVSVRRNRNALVASEILMIMQQFCGVNVGRLLPSPYGPLPCPPELTALGKQAD